MAIFRCPQCQLPHLEITRSLYLGWDATSDDIILQAVACNNCTYRGYACYRESRRGAMDSESWDHRASGMSHAHYSALVSEMATCPESNNEKCTCPAHKRLGRKDESGRWVGFEALESCAPYSVFLVCA